MRKIRGLYKRYNTTCEHIWHIDKWLERFGRLCESTACTDRKEAERYLEQRAHEIRELAVWLDQINNDSFNAFRNARQDITIATRNAKIAVVRRILKLAWRRTADASRCLP